MLAKGDLVGRAWASPWSEEPLVKVRMAGSLFYLLSADEAIALARELVGAADTARELAADRATTEEQPENHG